MINQGSTVKSAYSQTLDVRLPNTETTGSVQEPIGKTYNG